MFVILPVLFLGLLARSALRYRLAEGWREAVLFGSVGAGLFAVAALELLSFFHLVFPLAIGLTWAVGAAGWFFWTRSIPVAGNAKKRPPKDKAEAVVFWAVMVIICVITGILLITFIIAVIAPPNTWDAMTYHLPRVRHWLSERSVAFYATDIPRQNNQLPGAEYLLLHIYALSGGDRLLNLLQWGALAGTASAVSLIARHLGSGPIGQSLSALAAVSIPMAILQSTSCQNDLVVAFWMCSAVFFWLRSMRTGHWPAVLAGAGAAGMALLTKGTALVILPVFLIFVFACLRSGGWRGIWKPLATALIVLVCVSGWGYRHISSLRDLSGGSTVDEVLLKDYSWQCVLSNSAKHVISECAVPILPFLKVCARFIVILHERIGIAIDDPRTTQGPVSNMLLYSHALHEDYAGNLLHLVIWGCFWLVALFWGAPPARSYALFILAAAVIFVLSVKWQPWVNRLHVPLFLLAAPMAGIVLDRRPVWGGIFAGILLLASLPYLLWNKSRPLVGGKDIFSVAREYQYFSNRPELMRSYGTAALEIEKSGCNEVGLKTGSDSWEYPLWALAPKGVKFCQISKHDRAKACKPCLLVLVDQGGDVQIAGGAAPILSSGNIQVFRSR